MNGTYYEDIYKFYFWRFQTISCAITAWILVSNALTLATIHRTETLKEKPMYKLVACLAAVDLTAGLMFIVHLLLIGIGWGIRKSFLGCQMIMTTAIFPMYNTILHQLLLAIDRYIAIVHPLRHKDWMTDKAVKKLVASSWIVSFAISCAGFLFPSDVGKCINLSSISTSYFYGFLYIPYMVNMPVMFGLHGLVWKTARKGAREINVIEIERNALQRQTQLSMVCENRATKICLITMLLFFLATFPFFHIVIALYVVEKGSELERNVQLLFTVSWTVLYSNSGANIFVYALKSKEYRQSLSKLLKQCCRRGGVD